MFSRVFLNTSLRSFNKVPIKKLSQNIEYTPTHEWIYYHRDYIKMGLTQKAIDQMTEIIYLENHFKKGDVLKKDQELVIIESVKSVEAIKAPFDCIVLGINKDLEKDLDNLNKTPECINNNWIVMLDFLL